MCVWLALVLVNPTHIPSYTLSSHFLTHLILIVAFPPFSFIKYPMSAFLKYSFFSHGYFNSYLISMTILNEAHMSQV